MSLVSVNFITLLESLFWVVLCQCQRLFLRTHIDQWTSCLDQNWQNPSYLPNDKYKRNFENQSILNKKKIEQKEGLRKHIYEQKSLEFQMYKCIGSGYDNDLYLASSIVTVTWFTVHVLSCLLDDESVSIALPKQKPGFLGCGIVGFSLLSIKTTDDMTGLSSACSWTHKGRPGCISVLHSSSMHLPLLHPVAPSPSLLSTTSMTAINKTTFSYI